MKIGILFPLSNTYPGMGLDFMDGLNTFLKYKQHTGNVTFLKEGIGFGAIEKDVCMKAEKLLISDDVDILIAYLDEKVLPILYPLVQATGKLMLVVNPGANYPVNWISQPNVIRLNLQHAFLCWLTGALAARSGNGNAALATTYYDCGYLHSAVIVKNFLDSGGNIKYNYINSQAYNESFDIKQLTDFLSGNPDCENLLCVFDELPASLFYRLLDKFESNSPLHLFTSPMMLQQKPAGDHKAGFSFSIDGYLPWQPGLENEANQLFLKTCTRPSTIFSLLGWETAMLLDEIIQQQKGDFANGDKIVSNLKTRSINSPRGELKLDPETQYYIAPAIRYSLKAGSLIPETSVVADLENEWRLFTSEPTTGAVTGWMNTYLCY
jgi:branched-chain amino acid transport system substrate-binding protein